MGLIKAGIGALGGTLADQWKEFFYCDALPNDVLMRRGQKQITGRSSNTKGNDNIISNGSGIAVADGQCMIIVDQGKIVEVCAEPGEYTFDTSSEPSIFSGKFGESLKESFKTLWKRFTYGGDTGKDQRVYYFNTKEILNNKFGTANPIMFEVVNKRIGMSRTVQVRCNGVYTYVISNPLVFYSRLCGNVATEFTRDEIDAQLKVEFVDALQPALGALAEQELRPAQIPAKANELKAAMNDALKQEWIENRGISVAKIALNPITLTDADMKKINEIEDAVNIGSNPFAMAGRMTNATADAWAWAWSAWAVKAVSARHRTFTTWGSSRCSSLSRCSSPHRTVGNAAAVQRQRANSAPNAAQRNPNPTPPAKAGNAAAAQRQRANSVRSAAQRNPNLHRTAGPAPAERSTKVNSVQTAVQKSLRAHLCTAATNAAGNPQTLRTRRNSAPNAETCSTIKTLSKIINSLH